MMQLVTQTPLRKRDRYRRSAGGLWTPNDKLWAGFSGPSIGMGCTPAILDPYPIPLGAAAWVAYWDARHGVAVDGSNNVTSWTSRVGSAVLTPPGNAPVYSATGSSTGGPTVTFTATSSQYLTTTDAALIAALAGNDLPFTAAMRVSAVGCVFSASDPTANTAYVYWRSGTNIMNCSKRSGSSGEVTVGIACTPGNEQAEAIIQTGTAVQLYANGGWGTETAQDVATTSAITTFLLGVRIINSTLYYALEGKVTAIGIASTAMSTANAETAMAAMALL